MCSWLSQIPFWSYMESLITRILSRWLKPRWHRKIYKATKNRMIRYVEVCWPWHLKTQRVSDKFSVVVSIFLCSLQIPGEDFQFDEHTFQVGWFNHQLVLFFPRGPSNLTWRPNQPAFFWNSGRWKLGSCRLIWHLGTPKRKGSCAYWESLSWLSSRCCRLVLWTIELCN